tara:strand:+ start:44 stop:271 length:228 start_codon:yes stop_codon:yes gene_type:complete
LPQGFRISAQLGDALLFMPRISASRATACYHAVLSTELMPARSTMAKPEKMGVLCPTPMRDFGNKEKVFILMAMG